MQRGEEKRGKEKRGKELDKHNWVLLVHLLLYVNPQGKTSWLLIDKSLS